MPKSEIDNWTVNSWRVEPRIRVTGDRFEDEASLDQAPPLWKDLTLASIVAVLLWIGAAAIFG